MSQKGRITTATDRDFWIIGAKPEDILIEDIAIALSRLPRWLGTTRLPISVADHSIRVAKVVQSWCPNEYALIEAALMHDAAEAYIGDLPDPLKKCPQLAGYNEIERSLQALIAERFHFDPALFGDSLLKQADRQVGLTEARDLKGSNCFRYVSERNQDIGPLPDRITPRSQEESLYDFLRFWRWVREVQGKDQTLLPLIVVPSEDG